MTSNLHLPDTTRSRLMPAALAALVLLPLAGRAQGVLDQSISVDGRYQAEILRMDRLSAWPKAPGYTMPRLSLEYDLTPASLEFRPSLFPLGTPLPDSDPYCGYLDLAAGSWLNSRLDAGYSFLPRESRWQAGIWIDHNSTSLWQPKLPDGDKLPRRFRYDERIGLGVSYLLDNGATLAAEAAYRLAYFNYYMAPEAPTQTLNNLQARIGLTSSEKASLRHAVEFRVGHAAYRDQLLPRPDRTPLLAPGWETTLSLSGYVEGKVSRRRPKSFTALGEVKESGGEAKLGIAADLDAVLTGFDRDYGLLRLTPYYEFPVSDARIRLGAEVDFSIKAGDSHDTFSTFHAAPSCLLYIPARHFTWYLDIGGGSRLNTVASRSDASLWSCAGELSTAPVFSPLDVALGFNGGPAEGFMRGVEGGLQVRYKAVSHQPLEGWYPLAMMLGGREGSGLLLDNAAGCSLHGLEVSGRLAWTCRDVAGIELNLAYSPQKGGRGFWNGADRPSWTGSAEVSVRPVSPLEIKARVDWRGVRGIYSRDAAGSLEETRLKEWFTVGAMADWQLTRQIRIGVEALNLSGRSNEVLPGVMTEGVTIAARAGFLF